MTWLNKIKTINNSVSAKAVTKVNSEQLLFNWQLVYNLVLRKAEELWDAAGIEQLIQDLQATFPDKRDSAPLTHIMMQRYEFYSSESTFQKPQQHVGEVDSPIFYGQVPL